MINVFFIKKKNNNDFFFFIEIKICIVSIPNKKYFQIYRYVLIHSIYRVMHCPYDVVISSDFFNFDDFVIIVRWNIKRLSTNNLHC